MSQQSQGMEAAMFKQAEWNPRTGGRPDGRNLINQLLVWVTQYKIANGKDILFDTIPSSLNIAGGWI